MQDIVDFVEQNYSKTHAFQIAEYLATQTEKIEEVIGLIKEQKEPASRRLAWYFSIFFDQSPQMVKPFIDDMISFLDQIKVSSIQRCFLRCISKSAIPEKYHAYLVQYTSEVILNHKSDIAVKAFAMDIFFQIAKTQPDLFFELEEMIDYIYHDASKGIQNKSRNLRKEIEKKRSQH
jgi:hypothetical protein